MKTGIPRFGERTPWPWPVFCPGGERGAPKGFEELQHERWAYRALRAPCCAASEGRDDGELVSGSVEEAGEFVPVAGMSERRSRREPGVGAGPR